MMLEFFELDFPKFLLICQLGHETPIVSPIEYEWEVILSIDLQRQAREHVKENNTWHIVNEISNQIFLDCFFLWYAVI